MKSKKIISLLVLSVVVTIVVICSLVFFIRIIKNKNEHTSVVISTLQKKMEDKENATLFAEKVEEIRSLENSIESRFVDPNKIDEFVSYLEGLGLTTGAEVVIESIDVPKDKKGVINFKLSISGTFQEVAETVTLLENIPYQVNVDQLYLNKDIKQNDSQEKEIITPVSTWQASMSFSILSLD